MILLSLNLILSFLLMGTDLPDGESSGMARVTKDRQPPNVILIITDDQGYGDLGFHQNPFIKTPVIDQLASESINFRNFYVSPVCAPTRASLMTGRYSIRTGVFDTYSGGAIMASEETTIAEVFRDAGYTTGLFGKWHLGDNYPSRPQDQGFTTTVWHQAGGIGQVGDIFNYYKKDSSYFDPVLWKNGKKYQSKGYCSDVFTDETIQFIQENREKPFFAYLSFNAPHTPLQLPQSYYDMYRQEEINPDYFRERDQYTHDMLDRDVEAARKVYGMVTNIDDNLGRLIAVLKKEKLYKNTIIVFMTDNGPQQHRYTGGFRGRKSSVREGGIHAPFYIKPVASMSAKKEIKTAAAHLDVLPTLASLCSIKLDNSLKLDGKNLAPYLTKKSGDAPSSPLFFEWQRSYPEKYRNMAVIKNGYKLVANTGMDSPLDQFELYHLAEDPYEANNLAGQHPEIATDLRKEIDGWYEDIMKSPHINRLPRIIIGSAHENPVLLNRNDARGMQLIWNQPDIHVSWDVSVASAGHYKVSCFFTEEIDKSGDLIFRIGNKNFTLENKKKGTRKLVFDSIYLDEGDFTIDGWYLYHQRPFITPFYIELEKLGT
ncbi:arylsulfatase [Fulvivirgaceae bacterium BMA12]|uniref:Arylsulfatase n=1 Tax=Agaribacillus aureus TaxID=3051825 RepID=A0ABT8LH43_9BACT|nr:arylsulfatase [Fulvivirgaceae bacterium BMA12]